MVYGDNPENKTPDSSAITQSGNLYVYCGNNPIMYRDLTGNSFLLTALVFIGVSTVIGGCVGAFSAACNKGTTEEIIESTIEGALTAAAAATIAILPIDPVSKLAVGTFVGGVIDVATQLICHDEQEAFVWDYQRTAETAIATGIAASVPSLNSKMDSVGMALGDVIIGGEVSVLMTSTFVIANKCYDNRSVPKNTTGIFSYHHSERIFDMSATMVSLY